MFRQLRDLTPNRATIVLSQRDNKQPNDLTFGRVSRKKVKLLKSSYPVGEEDLADASKMALDAMDEKFDEINKVEEF